MINPDNIMPGMPVISSLNEQFAIVECIEYPNAIKLKKPENETLYYIPLIWVVSTENGKVQIDRSAEQAMDEWSINPPRLASY